jgi:hypothetical protein
MNKRKALNIRVIIIRDRLAVLGCITISNLAMLEEQWMKIIVITVIWMNNRVFNLRH